MNHISIRSSDWHHLGNIAHKLANEVLCPKLKTALFTIEAKGTQCKILANLDWVMHGGELWPLVGRLRDQCRMRVIWEISKCHNKRFTTGDEEFSPSDPHESAEDHRWEWRNADIRNRMPNNEMCNVHCRRIDKEGMI